MQGFNFMIYFHWRKYQDIVHSTDGDITVVAGNGGSTICMEPIQGWFFDQLKEGDFFDKKIGMARCHPDDTYCKKTGREEALKKAKTKRLVVVCKSSVGITLTDGEFSYILLRRIGTCNISNVVKNER
jgi:hypothetical protein